MELEVIKVDGLIEVEVWDENLIGLFVLLDLELDPVAFVEGTTPELDNLVVEGSKPENVRALSRPDEVATFVVLLIESSEFVLTEMLRRAEESVLDLTEVNCDWVVGSADRTVDRLMEGSFLELVEDGVVAEDSVEVVNWDVDGRTVKAWEAEMDTSSVFREKVEKWLEEIS